MSTMLKLSFKEFSYIRRDIEYRLQPYKYKLSRSFAFFCILFLEFDIEFF